MSTKIKLEYPYSEKWKTGYLVTNKENRKTLILFNTNKDRSSTQYARYLISVKLGRFLTNEETVDHIDNDKTNDSLDNLQVLTGKENRQKSSKKPNINLICPVCNIKFSKSLTELRGRKEKAAKGELSCSRSCGNKFANIKKLNDNLCVTNT